MALADVQTVLARLFTDAVFRAAFFDGDPRAGGCCRLGATEADALARLSRTEVEAFAATLIRKRTADVRTVLPLTARALGPAFGRAVAPVLAGAARPGRHRDDAGAVAAHLAREARAGTMAAPWAADLARWEAAFGDAQRRRVCLLMRRFRYPVADLATAILSGAAVVTTPRMTVSVWIRWPGRDGPFHRTF